jgi:ABC-type bacteriocin/lantibiotic exporter with double-glycine peptidase domain
MKTADIIQIIRETCLHLKLHVNETELQSVYLNQREYEVGDILEFKRDLIEAGRKCNLLILDQNVPAIQLESVLLDSKDPLITFVVDGDDLKPEVFVRDRSETRSLFSGKLVDLSHRERLLTTETGEIVMLTALPYKQVVGEYPSDSSAPSPMKRLFKLFGTEKKDISYILIYALIIGLLSLVLPLGLQTTVELISGGVFFSSVYILIGLVILGVLTTGVLQIVQISIVEQLQRRVFVRAALEFAYRIPRVKLEALTKSYAPELVNRFFDIITIQKGLPKLLLDLSSGAIQILFGLLLLSLYHPFFVFFSLFLVSILTLMFYFTGPPGLHSSLNESKYKYKVVEWLEEIARAIKSFKLAGDTDLPARKTDLVAGNYIQYRKKHFGVLLTQFSFFVFFKVAITGGLLIMGTILVVDRQITLGQFVASEVIIILVLNAVEKIILYVDVVYDLLTAVEKVSHVTDLPLEKSGGFDLPKDHIGKGYSISLHNLGYAYADKTTPVLKNINLEIGAGERICICGPGGSGKSTLADVIGGLLTDYSGGVAINNFSLHDLDITHLRNKVAKNISPDDLFEGTIYENITIGKATARVDEVLRITEEVRLSNYLRTLPDGLNTRIISGGKGLSSSTLHRLILSRCMAKKPELMILNDFFSGLSKADKLDLIRLVINPESKWTLLAVSSDPLVMASCDRVIVLDEGSVVADGSYDVLMKQGVITKYFE